MLDKKKFIFVLLGLPLCVWLMHCAGQVPPSGGPQDTIPPEIIFTHPPNNAVNVQTDRIVIEFSEYVERRTMEESIFISPYVGDLEFDWGSTDVTIMFSEALRENLTYVVNVGTDVIDRRAKNRMAAGFTLAFSTGDSIDQGAISGMVFDEKPEGIMVFAYILDRMNPDSLNPAVLRPDYIMQTGKGGNFTLSNVALGHYRLFAVRDEYRDLIYNIQIDQYGVSTRDVIITAAQQRAENVWFRMAKEDTSRPFLTSATSLNRSTLRVSFSEPIDSVAFAQAVFTLTDTMGSNEVPIRLAYLQRNGFMTAGIISGMPLDSGASYRISVQNVIDRAGNPLDSMNASMTFVAAGGLDTLSPTLSFIEMRDSLRDHPLAQPILLSFSEPVDHQPLEGAMQLRDGENLIPAELRWFNATDCAIVPVEQLKSKTWYQVSIHLDSARDMHGNRGADSTVIVRFETRDLRLTGTIEGTVVDVDDGATGTIMITATSIGVPSPETREMALAKPGIFIIDQLPEGRYTLQAFRDADSSRSYTYGLPFPFAPAERFTVAGDTAKVRARWNVEGVLLRFR
ncbi:MAG: Ig-like domain-containing protein [Bacteroidota bacterium]